MPTTKSELLFEQYLQSQDLTTYHYEKNFEHTSKKPDYALEFGGSEILFEVKEFQLTTEDLSIGFGGYDPYVPIREKIDQARDKFRKLKQYCCCLVLYNAGKPLVDLGWKYIYASMLGDLGFRLPFAPPRGLVEDEAEEAFLYRGKMHASYDESGRPTKAYNTTIAAIVVLNHYRGNRPSGAPQLRVVVNENPYASNPLGKEIFCGPYDERYGNQDGKIERIFAGEGIVSMERIGQITQSSVL